MNEVGRREGTLQRQALGTKMFTDSLVSQRQDVVIDYNLIYRFRPA